MSQGNAPAGEKRLCLFAHFHPMGLVGDHVLIYLEALRDAGFQTIVASTSPISDENRQRLKPYCAEIRERENVGADFGGWADIWATLNGPPPELVLLANDSVYAPIGDLGGFIDDLLSHPADFYGAVKSLESGPHLQSWFLLLRPAAFNSRAFLSRMESPPTAQMSKWQLIDRYEVGLTRDLVAEGLTCYAAYDPDRAGQIAQRFPMNATLVIWKRLVETFGIPFIKVEVLRSNPNELSDVGGWKPFVARYNKPLADAIERDVETRFAPRSDALPARLRRSFHRPYPSFWPELNPFLRRDAALPPASLASTINRAAFAATRMAATPGRLLLLWVAKQRKNES